MKLAIIGTGIAGNVLGYHLHKDHDITVFEANSHIGGHTHTHDIYMNGCDYRVDTGFIVFNYQTYPKFIQLLQALDVAVQKSQMSFSVKCDITGLEYNGHNLNTLFAQRKNVFKPAFYRMITDITRFNRTCLSFLDQDDDMSLGTYLTENQYSQQFIDQYIVPMGSAIWSSSYEQMMAFPARFFIRFFKNHGLLNVVDRPDWYVIENGSQSYVEKLVQPFKQTIRLNTAVTQVKRFPTHVEISTDGQAAEKFDYVFFACHSNQVLQMLDQPDRLESEILKQFPYQNNEVILHTDTSILPKHKLAWAAWNYHRTGQAKQPVAVTYNMNILQGLDCSETFCVTLNHTDAIEENKIIKRLNYAHPLFTQAGIAAQKRHTELNSHQRCFYAGAYWRNGFHEDGVVSALQAIDDFNTEAVYAKQTILRAG